MTKTYTINKKTFTQSELTLRQDMQIAGLFGGIDVSNPEQLASLTFSKIVKLLSESNVVPEFLRIILIPSEKSETLSDDEALSLTNTKLKEIINDFFLLNPEAATLLKSLSGKLASWMMSTTSLNSEIT